MLKNFYKYYDDKFSKLLRDRPKSLLIANGRNLFIFFTRK